MTRFYEWLQESSNRSALVPAGMAVLVTLAGVITGSFLRALALWVVLVLTLLAALFALYLCDRGRSH